MTRILLGLVLCLSACSKSKPPASPPISNPPASGGCVKTGCSGIVCAAPGEEIVTTCEYRAEYACYKTATCERQPTGLCGWTQTAELTACLANPPPMAGPGSDKPGGQP
jgi:eight-cysteine-cluster-containing protein